MNMAHRQLFLRLSILPLILLAVLLVAGRGRPAFAGDNYDPAGAVKQDLTSKGYNVLTVGLVADDVGHPGVVMKIASQQLDARVTAQLQDGWTALRTYYRDPARLSNYLEYKNRYWLTWVISADDWDAWLGGTLPSEEFWTHVTFGVWDNVKQQPVEARTFLNKNFAGAEPPGPQAPVDPADPNASVLLDAASAFVPAASGAGTTLLARVSGASGERLADQPVTVTVVSGVGSVSPGLAIAGESGTARIAYSPGIDAVPVVSGTSGLPVEVIAYGAGGPAEASRVKLLVASPPGADLALAKSRLIAAMKLQDYRVYDIWYVEELYPVGNVNFIYAGPQMEAASAELDATLFHQIKIGMGTARATIPNITNLAALIRFPYGDKVYNIQSVISASEWDSWIDGTIDEVQMWQKVTFTLYDENWNQVDQIDHSCKDFGAGCGGTSRSELALEVTSAVTQEEWGAQHSYGKIYISPGSVAGSFQPQIDGAVREWRIYQAPNFSGAPIYSSADDGDGSKLRDLVLGAGHYVVAVYTDSPPATLNLHYTEYVSY